MHTDCITKGKDLQKQDNLQIMCNKENFGVSTYCSKEILALQIILTFTLHPAFPKLLYRDKIIITMEVRVSLLVINF